MSFTKEAMKAQLLRDKIFLKKLYISEFHQAKKVLNTANDSELDTLLKYLYFLSVGEIEITKKNFEKINEAKKLKFLMKTFDKKSKVSSLVKNQRFEKLKVLIKFVKLFPELLYGLFNEQ